MTQDVKWLTLAIGLFVCFYVGWLVPLLWLLLIGLGIALLIIPTKKKIAPQQYAQQSVAQQNYIAQPVTPQQPALDEQLRELATHARNDDVREGILQALAAVQSARAAVANQQSVQQPTGQPQYVQPMLIQQVPLSVEQIAEDKKKQELKNINTILYVACFLLVGAAALFVGFSPDIPPMVKFVAVTFVTAAFYVAGISLYQRSERLKPAATAFVGTGLALIPFSGLALYSYVLQDGQTAWLITSLVGFISFFYAMLRIRSVVLSYFTVAFIFSITTSGISVLQVPFVWFFLVIIATSTVLLTIGYKKPRWLPAELAKPIQQNAEIAVPVAVVGSVFAAELFVAADYSIILGIAALHYCIRAYILPSVNEKFVSWNIARVLIIPFVMTTTFSLTHSSDAMFFSLLIVALALHGYSTLALRGEAREIGWFWAAQGMVLASIVGLIDVSTEGMNLTSALLLILIGLSIQQVSQTKKAELGTVGVLSIAALPLTILLVNYPEIFELRHVGLIVLGLAAVSFIAKVATRTQHTAYKELFLAAYVFFSAESMLLAAFDTNALWFGSLSLAVAGLLYSSSYFEKQIGYMIVSSIVATAAVYFLFGHTLGSYMWAPFATAVTLGSVWYALRWYVEYEDNSVQKLQRIDVLSVSSIAIVLFGAAISMVAWEETVAAGALMGVVGAGIVAYEGYVRGRKELYEIALYIATFALQRLVSSVYPDANFLVYTHWWAVTAAVGGLLALSQGKRSKAKVRGVISLVALSVPTGLFAIDDPSKYQILFLLEHVALIVGGLLLNKKIALQWGAIGVALAMLWLLKGYGYVLLIILGLGLIGFAIWRLMKRT